MKGGKLLATNFTPRYSVKRVRTRVFANQLIAYILKSGSSSFPTSAQFELTTNRPEWDSQGRLAHSKRYIVDSIATSILEDYTNLPLHLAKNSFLMLGLPVTMHNETRIRA